VDYNLIRVFLNDRAYTVCVPRKCNRCRTRSIGGSAGPVHEAPLRYFRV